MWLTLKKIGNFFSSMRGWLYFLLTIIPAISTFIATLVEELPWSTRILLVTSSAASGFILAYFALLSAEFISEKYGFCKEVNAVADNLQNMLNAGNQYVKVQMVADMWAGDDKDKVWVWNPRLRKLKEAIDAGEIDYLKQGNEKPSKNTDAKIESVIAFLRNLRSL